jgi:RNA polymerase sigma-70 factor (ECF subfamily)
VIASAAIVMPRTSTDADSVASAATSAQADIGTLTERLAAGNEDAFRQFHAVFFDRLMRYLIVVTRGNEDAARDALQETFMRVVRHARRFDSEETFWSWLTVLARCAALDDGRKRQRYWQTLRNYARLIFNSNAVPDPNDNCEEHLLALALEGVNDLSAGDRELVEGKYLRNASVRELAVAARLTEKAVESRLGRARRLLRERVLKGLKNEEADRT